MKNIALILVHIACGLVLIAAACSGSTKSKLKGSWRSKDGSIRLKITGKHFVTENDSPVPEDYYLKEDTIYTSFEGNPPTRFVIQKLDEHELTLLYPDSVSIEFAR